MRKLMSSYMEDRLSPFCMKKNLVVGYVFDESIRWKPFGMGNLT
jgi:hypothetical protein